MAEFNEWQYYFDKFAPEYDKEEYALTWSEEVDFMEDVFQLGPGSSVLDVGCGTGRHSVELARRGYQVTGIDFSAGMLAVARQKAEQVGVHVDWIEADVTTFRFDKLFDAAICMTEAAFALLTPRQDPSQHDMAILRNVNAALKLGGQFMLNATNGFRMIRLMSAEDIANGNFDPVTLVNVSECTWDDADGNAQSILARVRNYLPTELTIFLQQSGFTVEHIWGGTYGRNPIDLDGYTINVISRKRTEVA